MWSRRQNRPILILPSLMMLPTLLILPSLMMLLPSLMSACGRRWSSRQSRTLPQTLASWSGTRKPPGIMEDTEDDGRDRTWWWIEADVSAGGGKGGGKGGDKGSKKK